MLDQKFEYKELDHEGLITLETISEADKFNHWMFKTIEPFCKGQILEIGSGVGNISRFFIEANYSTYLSDIRNYYCNALRTYFEHHPNCLDVFNLDIADPNFDTVHAGHLGFFDTVVILNVVEHIRNDEQAIINCLKLLKPGGRLIVLVPAYQALYNQFDKELHHYRRYTKKSFLKLLDGKDLRVIKSFYFNFAGIPGWYISGRWQKNRTIPDYQMSLFDKLVPIFKLTDKLVMGKVGLSLITVIEKGGTVE